jgi:hypothetical protein
MPVQPGDSATTAYGLWPFGVHGGGHAEDGHPGWDVEFRLGASAVAAADGEVLHAVPDPSAAGRYTLRLMHRQGTRVYHTDYTNIAALAPGVTAGAQVKAGQPLGLVGWQTLTIGRTPVTFAMIHFQVNDSATHEGLTNPNAVSPLSYLTPAGRTTFDAIWATASYGQEVCEPFPGNPRTATFPLNRTWTLVSGGLPARIDFTCVDPREGSREYTLRDAGGRALESGTVNVDPLARPVSTIDLRPAAGAARLGVYDIRSDTLEIALGESGAARPAGLAHASVYRTR